MAAVPCPCAPSSPPSVARPKPGCPAWEAKRDGPNPEVPQPQTTSGLQVFVAEEKLKAPLWTGQQGIPILSTLVFLLFETAICSPQAQCGLLSMFITEVLQEWWALRPLSHAVAG